MSPRSKKKKMLGPFCNQTVNLESDAKTLYLHYISLKLKYSPFIILCHICKEQKRLVKINILLYTTATEITQTG